MEPRDNIFQQFKEAADKAADKASFPAMDKVWARVEEKLEADRPKRVIPFRKMAVAAAILLLICSGTVYFLLEQNQDLPAHPAYAGTQDVQTAGDGNNYTQQATPVTVPPGNTTVPVTQPGRLVPGYEPRISNGSTTFAISSGDAKDSLHTGFPASYTVQATVQEEDRRRYTGSVAATVIPDQMSSRPVTDIVGALEAMAPGLQPSSGGGQPGSAPQIQIRSRNAFGNYTEPSVTVNGQANNEYYKVYSDPAPEIFGMSTRTITGKISDADGNGIPGVSISVKGAAVNTVTNENGEYVLRIPLKNDTLLIAGMGADTNNVIVGNNDDVSIMMASFPRELKKNRKTIVDEPVYSGSTSAIASKVIGSRSVTGSRQPSLEKAAGVPAPRHSSNAGRDAKTELRGQSTVNTVAASLIIVDGKPYDGTLQSIDPDVIRNVTILKDQEGTAIYGSRGSNGVIVVTTIKSDSTISAGQTQAEVQVIEKKRNFFGRTTWKIKRVFRKK